MANKKLISIVSSCYNEGENLEHWYNRVKAVADKHPEYNFEFIMAENGSTDNSEAVLRRIAARDPQFKVILNARNFGHIRSPFHAILQASGDAVTYLASDLQDPPETIHEFIQAWEEGYKIAAGVKKQTIESVFLRMLRKIFYSLLNKLSEVPLISDFTGFGLYDRVVIEAIKQYPDPYPYLRGLVSEIGFKAKKVYFVKAARSRGITSNNFYSLYDNAMIGFVNHTKVPLRAATFIGFISSGISLGISVFYLLLKLIFWDWFNLGLAPILIGFYFFASIQLFFIGILGEYIGAIYTQVKTRPLIIERERINF